MPLILTLAAFGPAGLKYLLPLPADAVLFGSGAAAWLAFREGRVSERWGWSLVFGSMVVGLLLGGFAFEGPLPAPAVFTGYLDPMRSLTRLGHAYAIVLGMLMLFLPSHARPLTLTLLIAGTLTTLAGMVAVAMMQAPAVLLAPGPGLAAVSALLMLGVGRAGARGKS
jgi:di/tricarboxylate transporter